MVREQMDNFLFLCITRMLPLRLPLMFQLLSLHSLQWPTEMAEITAGLFRKHLSQIQCPLEEWISCSSVGAAEQLQMVLNSNLFKIFFLIPLVTLDPHFVCLCSHHKSRLILKLFFILYFEIIYYESMIVYVKTCIF